MADVKTVSCNPPSVTILSVSKSVSVYTHTHTHTHTHITSTNTSISFKNILRSIIKGEIRNVFIRVVKVYGDVEEWLHALTLRSLTLYIYIYGAPILDVSRSHTTTQHSR